MTDFQAVCEEKNGVNSHATSFMFKVLDFFLVAKTMMTTTTMTTTTTTMTTTTTTTTTTMSTTTMTTTTMMHMRRSTRGTRTE